MRTTSRFTKVAVSAGLIVVTGAGVLGITSFASAELAGQNAPTEVVVASDGSSVTDLHVSGSANVEAQSSTTKVAPLTVAAEALGMTEAELRTELESGKSIAQVAEAKNVDIQKVIAALVTKQKEHIAEHVTEGKLTQAQADAKLADLETRVTEMVNTTGLPAKGGKGGHGGRGGAMGRVMAASEKMATVLKMTVEELRTEILSGKSLATIAGAQNVDISAVKDVLTSEFKAHLDEEVASGKHTQAEADEKLAQFESRVDDMVNGVVPQGGMHRGKGGHGGRGGLHGSGGHDMGQPPAVDGSGTSATAHV